MTQKKKRKWPRSLPGQGPLSGQKPTAPEGQQVLWETKVPEDLWGSAEGHPDVTRARSGGQALASAHRQAGEGPDAHQLLGSEPEGLLVANAGQQRKVAGAGGPGGCALLVAG